MPSQELFAELEGDDSMSHECAQVQFFKFFYDCFDFIMKNYNF